MIKTRIKDLTKGDYVKYGIPFSNNINTAKVDHIVTDMTHHRDIARVKTFDGKEGILTDNDSWLYVGGKVDESFCGDKVSNKKLDKEKQTNDVQQKKRFEHLKGNLSRMERLHGVKLDELTPNDMRKLVGEKEEPNDIVNKPSHYTYGKIEVIDYCEQVCKEYPSELAPYVFNVIKYISRSELKNGKEDCEKAKFYLKRIIEKWDDAHE